MRLTIYSATYPLLVGGKYSYRKCSKYDDCGGVHGNGIAKSEIFVVSEKLTYHLQHFAFNSFWLHFQDF